MSSNDSKLHVYDDTNKLWKKALATSSGVLKCDTTLDKTGLATNALQTTGNSSLSSIDGKITACDTGAVVVTSCVLPTNASTDGLQTVGNSSLNSIDGKVATSVKQDTQIAQQLNKDGFSQVLLSGPGGILIKADSTCVVRSDPENRKGWNCVNEGASTKFNFYFFGGLREIVTLGEVGSIYWKGFINVKTETESMPYIQIYTKPTGVGDAGLFYHSSIIYQYDNDNTIGIGEECVYYAKAVPTTLFNNRKVAFNNVTVLGDGLDTEEILYMTLHSDSGATVFAMNTTVNLMGFNTASLKRNMVLETEPITQPVTAVNLPLPTGASTDALQTTGNSSLSSIDGKITACNTNNVVVSNITTCDTSNISGSVSVSNNTDPATATLQTAGNASLTTIAGDTTSLDAKITVGNDSTIVAGSLQQVLLYGKSSTGDLHSANISNGGDLDVEIADFVKGQAVMASSFPVVISSDQSTLNVRQQEVRNLGSHENIASDIFMASGDISSSVDVSSMSVGNIFYEDTTTTSFDSVDIQASVNSGTNWFKYSVLYPTVETSGFRNARETSLSLQGITDIRIKNISSTDSNTNVRCTIVGSP